MNDKHSSMMHTHQPSTRRWLKRQGERPVNLDQLGLVAALQKMVAEGQEWFGIQCEFAENIESTKLTATLEMVIFQIAQEALTNALRHSNSPTVLMTLTKRGGKICLTVEDWGMGFDVKEAETGGFGLERIRQHAQMFGGRVGIRSSPGRVTLLKVRFPIQEKRRKEETDNRKELQA